VVPETVSHFIGGRHVHSTLRKTFPVADPATGKEYAQVEVGLAADVNQAVLAARTALESGPWPGMAAPDRARVLHRVADAIDARADDVAAAEARSTGLPVTQSREQTARAGEQFRLAAELITQRGGRRARPVRLRGVAPGRRRRTDHALAHAVPGSGPGSCARPGGGLHGRAQAR
jgi:acyl-CoA reductase-like NAD-dependent aldehyde dehydrogenase